MLDIPALAAKFHFCQSNCLPKQMHKDTLQTGTFQAAVLSWFDQEGRKTLPWQTDPAPYRVWVSEIMLQQTQVATVIPYFVRFMDRFPDLKTLALASGADVLGHWAGLGYYARARNLHKAAQVVLRDFAGELPANAEALVKLPGIGRSTASAIVSLALGIRAPILDGNVKRVLSRYAGVAGWAGETKILEELWQLSERLTPHVRVGDYNQAMMDLGAILCTRSKPSCCRCPLQTGCFAYAHDLTGKLPTPRPKKEMPQRSCFMLVLHDGEGRFYMEKRPPVGVWGGLWSFLQFDTREDLTDWCQMRKITANLAALPEQRHTFSHYHLDFTPLVGRVKQTSTIAEEGAVWAKPENGCPLPAPVRRLMLQLGDSLHQHSFHSLPTVQHN